MQSTLVRQHGLTLSQLEFACESLNRLYQACHWRKIEMYLIPAIRQATQQADQLLDELGRLNDAALAVIRALQDQVATAQTRNDSCSEEVGRVIDSFCEAMLRRLDKEEKELFAVARSAIGGEAWFAIANQFLLHDAHVAETRRCRGALPAPVEKLMLVESDRDEVLDAEVLVPTLSALPVAVPEDELEMNIPVSELKFNRRQRPPSRAMME
ncbi:hemerythrin domain-containing protein [Pseudoduganella namucuonensis]|uniref:hemerythrin domain-containing protein n=1 Tax=Pseudoduganella namucuonensis TaxID=1035707 RepID=UPI0015A5D5E4|nr:hemerythrin domain-containing protein [Pseudoduganella namucuonensis]